MRISQLSQGMSSLNICMKVCSFMKSFVSAVVGFSSTDIGVSHSSLTGFCTTRECFAAHSPIYEALTEFTR